MLITFTKIVLCIAALTSLTCPSFAQKASTAKANAPKAAPSIATKKLETKRMLETKKTRETKSGAKKAFEGTLSLNKATALELESLPGIGPAIAARIIAYRTEQGKFSELSELRAVKGIGEKKLAQLRPHLTLD